MARLELKQEEEEGNGEWIGTCAQDKDERVSAAGEVRRRPMRGGRRRYAGRGMGDAYDHSAEQGNTVNVLTDFDHPELKILHGNMKFDQNKSCRGKEDLELSFWAKVDLELGLGRKHAQIPARFK